MRGPTNMLFATGWTPLRPWGCSVVCSRSGGSPSRWPGGLGWAPPFLLGAGGRAFSPLGRFRLFLLGPFGLATRYPSCHKVRQLDVRGLIALNDYIGCGYGAMEHGGLRNSPMRFFHLALCALPYHLALSAL